MEDILDVEGTQTETSTETPTEGGWITPDGKFSDNVPEDIKGLLEAKKWNSVDQLVKGYRELEKLTGTGKHLVIPDDDNPDAWANVYNALGRPESPDKYELQYEGEVPISDELVSQFKEYAHGLGLNQKQFNDIVSFQLDVVDSQLKALEEQKQAAVKQLKEKWGEANYDTKVRQARQTADKLGIYDILEKKGLASDPDIILMLDAIANKIAEDTITRPASQQEVQKSPEERLAEIKKSEAFTKRFHPDHKKIMAEYLSLTQQLANEGKLSQPRI